MSGSQIERLLELIETNVSMTRSEIAEYIVRHKTSIAQDLNTKGSAFIKTRAGVIEIKQADLARIIDSVSAAAA